jgi:hypothetical protein
MIDLNYDGVTEEQSKSTALANQWRQQINTSKSMATALTLANRQQWHDDDDEEALLDNNGANIYSKTNN